MQPNEVLQATTRLPAGLDDFVWFWSCQEVICCSYVPFRAAMVASWSCALGLMSRLPQAFHFFRHHFDGGHIAGFGDWNSAPGECINRHLQRCDVCLQR